MRLIQKAASKLGVRLFRNNIGIGWVGSARRITHHGLARVYPGDVIVHNARPLHAGLFEGSSDLIGWTPVGRSPRAIFTSVEVKTKSGRIKSTQQDWIDTVAAQGGISLVARSPDEAVEHLKKIIAAKE